jgi:hypothetical protein
VNSVRGLYERFRQLIHEGAKFGVVGGIGFVVADGGTNLLQSTLHLTASCAWTATLTSPPLTAITPATRSER